MTPAAPAGPWEAFEFLSPQPLSRADITNLAAFCASLPGTLRVRR
jgi:hypothetical protein